MPRTCRFKPVHVKSLPAHAVRSLISARKKLVGRRVMLENQIRGLAVVFGVRLPRGLSGDFVEAALRVGDGIENFQYDISMLTSLCQDDSRQIVVTARSVLADEDRVR